MYSKADIDEVKALALTSELTPAAKGRGVYLCPACGRPRVYNPTSAGIWYCQRCHEKGDVFTAVRLRDGMTQKQAFADVMNRYGHGQTVSGPAPARPRVAIPAVEAGEKPGDDGNDAKKKDAWRAECRRYLLQAAAALPGSAGEAYMIGRGFTMDTLKRFYVGFDDRAKVHGALKYGRAAVVYPYSRRLDYYGARFLKPITNAGGDVTKAMKPPADRAGDEPLFNAGALYSCKTVVIVEGAFDAMAIAQGAASIGENVGAVALGGTSCGRLIDMLTEKPTAARLLIALDNDDAGKVGALAMAAKLDTIGQQHKAMDCETVYGGMKDAGEALQQYGTEGAAAVIEVLLHG